MRERQDTANGHTEQDHQEAAAALRKAIGLERLLARLRAAPDVPVAPLRPPRRRRARLSTQDHAHAAA
jgi:hypothetical protein